jgi:heparinase II/III-like protein
VRHSLRYMLYRGRRLSLPGLAAAVNRRARVAMGRVATEAKASIWGTQIGDRALRAALRPEARDGAMGDGAGLIHAPGFFLAAGERDAVVKGVRSDHPEAVAIAIRSADAICSHTFDLLGSGPTPLGPSIDWHRDFRSGFRWDPRAFSARLRYGDTPGADVKVPWELSRFQHLPALGKAYWLTGADRYAEEFVAELTHWMDENPPEFGVNWICSMDIAIRAFNWLWGYAFFQEAPQVTTAFRRRLAGSLLAHGRHVRQHLERGADGITSNHYLANLVGLVGLGFACPAFREAQAWREFALSETFREIERQVHPDGGDYESSIPYHRLVAEMFLAAAILCRRNGVMPPDSFHDRLRSMLDFILWYTKPNGLAPQVGDADDGRLHILADYGAVDPRDHRHLLATGGAFFGRDDCFAVAGERTEEAIWLLGGLHPRQPGDATTSVPSRAFPDSGIYLMRGKGLYLLIACGAVGTQGIGNHKHNDVLSFEFQVDGQDLIVDSGSYIYTPEPAWRNHFRSTAAHNTVMVDDAEQNRFGEGSLFWLHADATPRCLAWESTSTVDRFVGEHDGYARLSSPVIHRREVRLDKRTRCVELHDWLRGSGRRSLAWNFTLASGVAVRRAGELQWELTSGPVRALFSLQAPPSGKTGQPVRPEVVEAWVSPRYGVKGATRAIRMRGEIDLPTDHQFRIEVY